MERAINLEKWMSNSEKYNLILNIIASQRTDTHKVLADIAFGMMLLLITGFVVRAMVRQRKLD